MNAKPPVNQIYGFFNTLGRWLASVRSCGSFLVHSHLEYLRNLPEDDLIARQRYRLFRITTLTASAVVMYAFLQALLVMESGSFPVAGVIGGLGSILVVNYFLLPFHRNHKFAYYVITLGAFATLHLITYYSGGIRASAIMYLAGTMLLGYMLLGNKAGRLVFGFIGLHIAWFWYLTENTDVISYVLVGSSDDLVNFDYLTTWLMAMVILSAQMNYLESGKNEVISRITLQREELKDMNRELAKLSTVASKAENAIVITDQNGRAEWVNDGFVRLTGYTLDEVKGRRTIDVLHGKGTSPESGLELQQAIELHRSFSGELLKYRKDGSPFWTQLNMTPIFSEEGSERKFIFIESDVTNRKIAEEKTRQYMKNLERTNSELDKFAYVVSHDLKAPLRAIGSLSDWIEEDAGSQLNAESLSHLQTIKGRVVRMEGLINGILDYTKAAKKNEEIIDIDSGDLVRETIDLLGPPARVMVNVRGEFPILSARKVKLQQVFMNLVSNAYKYNDKEDQQIEIGCEFQGSSCIFYVKDNGPGIEKAYHEKIFVIFQTLNARDEVESRGVGLAIVKKIVEEEGGRIWVESEQGKGACFRFVWPRTARVTPEESVFLADHTV